MPLEVEQNKQLEKGMFELGKFLTDSAIASLSLPDQFNSLLPSLKTNLKKLGTAQGELERIEKTDISGNDPSFATYRRVYWDQINEVRSSFYLELIPLARKLYGYIKEQPDGQMLADRLILLIQIEEQSSSVHSGVSKVTPTQKPPPIIITFNQLKKLENRQRTLDSLVRGFMAARDQLVFCSEAKLKLEEGKRENSVEDIFSDEYWNEITVFLKDVLMIGKDYDLSMFSDIKGFSDEFRQELDAATLTAEKVAESSQDMSRNALKNTIVEMLRHVDNSVRLVRRIADKCRERAQTELEGIRELIDGIFTGGQGSSEPSDAIGHSTSVDYARISPVPTDIMRTAVQNPESPEAAASRTPTSDTTPSS